jgi:hypothetical protein
MKHSEKFILITFLVIFLVYNTIGYVFDTDVLRFITFAKHGFGMSFVGIIAPLITTYLIYFTLKYLNININFNE